MKAINLNLKNRNCPFLELGINQFLTKNIERNLKIEKIQNF
jgi:hypothetical protein